MHPVDRGRPNTKAMTSDLPEEPRGPAEENSLLLLMQGFLLTL